MAADAPVALEAVDIRDDLVLNGVSLSVRKGEILGISGLTGAGRSELMQALIGLRPAQGEVTLNGKPFAKRSVLECRRRGMVLVSEDRRSEQAFLERTVRENLTASRLDRVSSRLGLMR
ncbi:ATP-binding cassette domain-containing protein, partial [Salmonella enterica subsp. enterica serovar Javiana]|nr:ATP-binding cassette domain-containing protein [Salmonella enterica subsp. enterica serovar Javiana]